MRFCIAGAECQSCVKITQAQRITGFAIGVLGGVVHSLQFKSMEQFKAAWPQVGSILCSYFDAGKEVQIDFRAPVRTVLDNAKLHAVLEPIRRDGVFELNIGGMNTRVVCSQFDAEKFKSFMVCYFCEHLEEMGEPLKRSVRDEFNPFTGKITQIRPTTTKWTKQIVSMFCECMRALQCESLEPIRMSKKESDYYDSLIIK
jgi:hypothetical protein